VYKTDEAINAGRTIPYAIFFRRATQAGEEMSEEPIESV
jgi:hypothetical protein